MENDIKAGNFQGLAKSIQVTIIRKIDKIALTSHDLVVSIQDPLTKGISINNSKIYISLTYWETKKN